MLDIIMSHIMTLQQLGLWTHAKHYDELVQKIFNDDSNTYLKDYMARDQRGVRFQYDKLLASERPKEDLLMKIRRGSLLKPRREMGSNSIGSLSKDSDFSDIKKETKLVCMFCSTNITGLMYVCRFCGHHGHLFCFSKLDACPNCSNPKSDF